MVTSHSPTVAHIPECALQNLHINPPSLYISTHTFSVQNNNIHHTTTQQVVAERGHWSRRENKRGMERRLTERPSLYYPRLRIAVYCIPRRTLAYSAFHQTHRLSLDAFAPMGPLESPERPKGKSSVGPGPFNWSDPNGGPSPIRSPHHSICDSWGAGG